MISSKEGWGMKRLAGVLLLAVLGVVLLCLGASQKLVNQTGEAASGVTLTFSDAVRITSYDKSVFPNQSPASGESESFTFSGGTLVAEGTFQVTWLPSNVKLKSSKWITSGSGEVTAASASAIPTTYDEIMAKIAQYPGPDEPLYVPAEGEAIWLTDLEGHKDIYDNDSIRINYAPGFDKNQITRIDVYRNGIKMRFLPEKLDVLTNEQMKTFDGNSEEHTPKSSHTDHAIFGYEYEFRLFTARSTTTPERRLTADIKSPIQFSGTAYGNTSVIHIALHNGISDAELQDAFRHMKEMGFEGVQFDVEFYMLSDTATEFFAQYTYDTSILKWYFRTMTRDEIRRVFRLIKAEGLRAEMRVLVFLTKSYADSQRSYIRPASWSTWFRNYTTLCIEMAKLAQEEGCDIFTPMVELIEPEKHTQEVKALLDAVAAVYSGEICVSQCTHTMIQGLPFGASGHVIADRFGHFWDWSAGSRALLIGIEYWPADVGIETQADTRYSVMVENLVKIYAPVVAYFRTAFPGHPIRFSEMGSREFDGAVLRGHWEMGRASPDHQEFADTLAALMAMAESLGVDVDVWSIRANWQGPRDYAPGQISLNGTPVMDLVDAMIP
jgi:hypothetical protein